MKRMNVVNINIFTIIIILHYKLKELKNLSTDQLQFF